MNESQLTPPQPREVIINGQRYTLVAFYFPGEDTPWDKVYRGQFLGNFYRCPLTLTINGITASFCTAEAAFQATKWWNNPVDLARFEKAATGQEAWELSRALQKKASEDENAAQPDYSYAGLGQDGAMQEVLKQKFRDPAIKQALLLTEDAYLLEHRPKEGRDVYWSDAHDGTGANRLGETLMSIRASLGGAPAPAGNNPVAQFTAQVEPKQ